MSASSAPATWDSPWRATFSKRVRAHGVGRAPDATAELERLGAKRAAGLTALAESVRITCTILPNDAIVQAVVLGERGAGGLLSGAQSGDVIFDLSTVSPGSTKRLAAEALPRGVRLIDAPVSGSVSGAVAGTLAVMIGATADVARPYEAVLKAIGTNLFYLGEVGRGNTLKLLNNLVALTTRRPSVKRWGSPIVSAFQGRWWARSWQVERRELHPGAEARRARQHDYSPASSGSRNKDLGLALELPPRRERGPTWSSRRGKSTRKRARPASENWIAPACWRCSSPSPRRSSRLSVPGQTRRAAPDGIGLRRAVAPPLVEAIPHERSQRQWPDEEQHADAAQSLQEFRGRLADESPKGHQERGVQHRTNDVEGQESPVGDVAAPGQRRREQPHARREATRRIAAARIAEVPHVFSTHCSERA